LGGLIEAAQSSGVNARVSKKIANGLAWNGKKALGRGQNPRSVDFGQGTIFPAFKAFCTAVHGDLQNVSDSDRAKAFKSLLFLATQKRDLQ